MRGLINRDVLSKIVPRAWVYHVLFLAVLTFVVYLPALNNGFVWDDHYLIEQNPWLNNLSGVKQAFSNFVGSGSGASYYYYRPLQISTYVLESFFWGRDPSGYHLTSIIMHVAAVICGYFLINILGGNRKLSFYLAAIFAVHPVNVATVSYLSARADIMVFLCVMLSFLFYIKYVHEEKKYYIAILFFLIAGLFSKENALVLPLFLMIYDVFFIKQKRARVYLPLWGICAAYILFRVFFLKGAPLVFDHIGAGVFSRIVGFFAALSQYVRLLILPVRLHIDYGYEPPGFESLSFYSGVGLFICMIWLAFLNRHKNRLMSFGIVWFLTALLPVSNLYPMGYYMAEHHLYLPFMGVLLFLAGLIQEHFKEGNIRYAGIFLIFALSLLSFRQNLVWKDSVSIFYKCYEYEKDDPRVAFNLAVSLDRAGDKSAALKMYEKTVEIDSGYVPALVKIGDMYSEQGDDKKAEEIYRRVFNDKKRSKDAGSRLSELLLREGKIDEGYQLALYILDSYQYDLVYAKKIIFELEEREEYEKVVSFLEEVSLEHPLDPDLYSVLARAYAHIGEGKRGVGTYQEAVDMFPENADLYFNMGNLYYEIEEYDRSISAYSRAIEIDGGYVKALNNLATVYQRRGRWEEALDIYKKLLLYNPDDTKALSNMALIYHDMGDADRVIYLLGRLLKLDPGNPKHRLLLMREYLDAGNIKKAGEIREVLFREFKDDAFVYMQTGRAYEDAGMPKEALNIYELGIRNASKKDELNLVLGLLYINHGDIETGNAKLQKAVELNPSLAETVNNIISELNRKIEDKEQV